MFITVLSVAVHLSQQLTTYRGRLFLCAATAACNGLHDLLKFTAFFSESPEDISDDTNALSAMDVIRQYCIV